MAICSYLVIPEPGGSESVARDLASLPGCEVVRAENHELLTLVTETSGPDEDRALKGRVEAIPGVHAMVLTFGEVVGSAPGEEAS